MKPHPLSEIFPSMEGAEFASLVEDIRTHGLAQPIVMYQGKILDGRNRARACEEIGVKPKTVDYRGNDPLGYVLSLNLSRRHLSESQRAMVAAKVSELSDRGGDRRSAHQEANLHSKPTISTAAKALNVSPRSTRDARKVVAKASPELRKAVERDEIPVSTAAKLSEAPAKVQRAAVEGGKAIARELVKKIELQKEPVSNDNPGTRASDAPSEPPVKTFGLTVPPGILARIEKEQGLIDKIGKLLAEAKRNYTDLESLRGVERFEKNKHLGSAFRTAINELNVLKLTRPFSICPYCKLVPEIMKTCGSCRGHGYVDQNGIHNVHPVYLQEGDLAIVSSGGKEVPLSHFSTDDF